MALISREENIISCGSESAGEQSAVLCSKKTAAETLNQNRLVGYAQQRYIIPKPMRSLPRACELDEAVNYSVDRGYNTSNRRTFRVRLRNTEILLNSVSESADDTFEDLMIS